MVVQTFGANIVAVDQVIMFILNRLITDVTHGQFCKPLFLFPFVGFPLIIVVRNIHSRSPPFGMIRVVFSEYL